MKEVPTLVKWAGGKKQLLNQIKPLLPTKIDNYIEPFVGGGAMAFYIISNFSPKKVILSDINSELINLYNVVKSNPKELIKELSKLKKLNNEKSFYKIRKKKYKEEQIIKRAARFIYLNKTCFNGLYRVNSGGQFNVPFANYSNPAILNKEDLNSINILLKQSTIECHGFEDVLKTAQKGDFIYFDPPYYPLKKGKSFTKYAKGDFLDNEQKNLALVFEQLDKMGCKLMLSNSDCSFIRDLYKNYKISTVQATRMINCNASKRGKINEVIVTNY